MRTEPIAQPYTAPATTAVSPVMLTQDTQADYAPQSVIGLFDGAFDLYKANALRYIVQVAAILIPTHIVLQVVENFWLTPLSQSLSDVEDAASVAHALQLVGAGLLVGVPSVGMPGLLSAFAFLIASIPVTRFTAQLITGQVLSQRTPLTQSIKQLIKQGFLWTSAAFAFIAAYSLIYMGLAMGVAFLFMGTASIQASSSAMAGVLVVLLFVLPYFLSCRVVAAAFVLATPLVILENVPIFLATSRNSQLIPKPVFRKVWLATACLPIALIGFQMLLASSVGAVATGLHLSPLVQFGVQAVFPALLSLFFQPYAMLFFTLLYYDMVYRREGLDIRFLARDAGFAPVQHPNSASPALSQPVVSVPPPSIPKTGGNR